MFESMKNKIAAFLVNKHLKELNPEVRSFNNLFKDSFSFLILMPENDADFQNATEFLKDIEKAGKNFSLLIKDYKIGLLPQKYHSAAIGYNLEDITRFLLPKKEFREKLSAMNFDLAIDLNVDENLFCSFAANLVNTGFKAGAKKKNSDRYYNIQVAGPKDNSAIFYKNFLNCLQMF